MLVGRKKRDQVSFLISFRCLFSRLCHLFLFNVNLYVVIFCMYLIFLHDTIIFLHFIEAMNINRVELWEEVRCYHWDKRLYLLDRLDQLELNILKKGYCIIMLSGNGYQFFNITDISCIQGELIPSTRRRIFKKPVPFQFHFFLTSFICLEIETPSLYVHVSFG